MEEPAPEGPTPDPTVSPRRQLINRGVEMLTGSEDTETAKQLGIGPGPAPFEARFKSGLWPEKKQQVESMLTNLQEQFGPDVRLRWVPELQRLAYQDPKTGWQLVDTPGLDWGDFADVAGDLIAPAAAIGALTIPGIRNVMAGAASRTSGGMRGFLKNARETGAAALASGAGGAARAGGAAALDPQVEEPPWMATKTAAEEALMSMLADAGIRVGAAGAKGAYNLYRGNTLPGHYVDAGLQIPELRSPYIDEVNSRLERSGSSARLQPTAGEILNDPTLLNFQQQGAEAASLRRQGAIQARKAEQADAYDAFVDEMGRPIRAPGATGPTEREAGLAVASEMERRAAGKEAAVQARVDKAQGAVDDTLKPLQTQAQATPEPVYFGPRLRQIADREQEDFRDWAGKAYGNIRQQADQLGIEIVPERLSTMANDAVSLFSKDIGNLRAEDARLAQSILQDIETMIPGVEGKTLVAQPYEQISRLVSNLRELRRRADDGLLGGVDRKFINDLTQAAIADRNASIEKFGSPEMVKDLLATEAEYRQRKMALNDTVVGDIIRKKNGLFEIPNEKVFDRVFYKDGVTDAQIFGDVLRDPRYVGQRDAFKGSIARRYLGDVAPNGIVDPKAHEAWMRDYGSVLKEYLDPQELELFGQVGGAARYLLDLKGRQETFLRVLNDTFAGRARKGAPGDGIRTIDPESIVDHIWKRQGNIEAAAKVLQDSPEVWRGVQQVVLRRVEDAITDYSPLLGREVVSFDKLRKFMDRDDGNNLLKLKQFFGDQYVQDLNTLLGAAEVTNRSAKNATPRQQVLSVWPMLDTLVQGYRNWQGPLSHESFLARRILKAKDAIEASNLTDMVLDPVALHEAAKAVSTSAGTRRAQIGLAEAGRTALGSGENYEGQVQPLEDSQYAQTPSVVRLRQTLSGKPGLIDKIRKAVGEIR